MKTFLLNISMLLILANANAQLLQKIIYYPGSTGEQHYNFYDNGLLKDIRKADGTLIKDFIYDANNNLTQTTIVSNNLSSPTTYTFQYDSNNHITNIGSNYPGFPAGGITIYFDSASNTYSTDPDMTDSNEFYMYWKMNDDMLLTNEWYNYFDDVEYTVYGSGVSYVNQNMTFSHEYDMVMNFWEFVDTVNPLRQASLPACRAYTLLFFDDLQSTMTDTRYLSANVEVTWDGHPDGPDFMEYSFELNANNLPYKKYYKHYYVGSLENEGLEAVYYYQGDVIP